MAWGKGLAVILLNFSQRSRVDSFLGSPSLPGLGAVTGGAG